MNDVHWAIDSFTRNNRTIFGYGWVFNKHKKINKIRFCLTGEPDCFVDAEYGKARHDVGDYFKDNEYAGHSGFFVYGNLNKNFDDDELKLACYYDDDTVDLLDIPSKLVNTTQTSETPVISRSVVFRQFIVLLKRGFNLLRSGNYRLLVDKIKRYKNKVPSKSLTSPDEIFKFINKKEADKAVFFLDHDLGGGANHYRERIVNEKIEQGKCCLILAFTVNTLSYKLIVVSSKGRNAFNISGYDFIYLLLKYIKIKEIIYNTGVSFCNPETIPDFLINLKIKTNASLCTLAHDLFPICPSHFLINDQGQYCDIPDPSVCYSCLRNNTYGFTTLFESGDIKKWRDRWGNLLIASDKVISFSESTLNLYKRVYPQIDDDKAEVTPHKVDYLPQKALITQTKHLKIGVVGQIGYHKGSKILQDLSKEILEKKYNIEIIVIGAVEASCPSEVVRQTGPYKHEDLKMLLEENGINVILFPSIWPETFSYVVQEMIELGFPVASFNLGAPAERLQEYDKGVILSSMNPEIVVQELIDMHRKIYAK
ncbi:glycosyltransferase [Pantoea sp. GD03673]|uniref:glycosyltransferase n=1 Tax=Pantoea sp. GD03673 TaxID=2975364 RepID=UPI002447D242|nr:glycosyltransferase [Pantoea sp. GD03673]MDH2066375.1 glycosyltransferase [Pantoea sp. GD03673]